MWFQGCSITNLDSEYYPRNPLPKILFAAEALAKASLKANRTQAHVFALADVDVAADLR